MSLGLGPTPQLARPTRSVAMGNVAVTVCATEQRQAYWNSVAAGQWEPQTLRAIRRFVKPDRSVLDFGAWIGPTVLFSAHFAGHVHAIEPDPVAYVELAANIAANPTLAPRIGLHNTCIAPQNGPIKLYAGGMYRGPTSRFGDTMSGIVPSSGDAAQESCTVSGMTLTDFLQQNRLFDCTFIKMDIEGGEYALIIDRWRHLAEFGMPTLNLSFHAPYTPQREQLIGGCLEELARCYRWLHTAIDGRAVSVQQLMSSVSDWSDDAPNSSWRRLEWLIGAGIVASNEAW